MTSRYRWLIAVPTLSAALLGQQCRGQLTYQLGNTLLDIDVVLDSTRVNIPWEILWGPDDKLWMTDGPLITRWDPVTDVVDTLMDRGRGNGLGMALHPDFPNTPIVMAVFDTADYYAGGQLCEVGRFIYDAANDTITDETVLFTYYHAGEHAAGRVLFDTTGNVLVTTPDYYLNGPDTLWSMVGKTLRFSTDGSVPLDNPRTDYTWTWGHRNAQGLAMLPNGAIITSEHGMAPWGNEINMIEGNHYYGWPAFDGDQCSSIIPDSCTSLTFSYTHALATFPQPPSGTEFYTSDLIPELHDKLITCVLWQRGLKLYSFTNELDSITAQEYLDGGAFDVMWRNRDIAIRPDGTFYLITNDRGDARIRWVHPDINTGVSSVTRQGFSIAPNPVEGILSITLDPGIDPITVTTLDAEGRTVYSGTPTKYGPTMIDTRNWSDGLYTVRLTHAHGIGVQRFVKSR
ncbi:MAG: PQQ-dependent sugar dehydrogenase [Flavobacteriales bacterium]